ERLEVAALDQDLVAVPEDDRPEAVPLRLVEPAIAIGQAVGGLGEHRVERRVEGEMHPSSLRPAPPAATGSVSRAPFALPRDPGSRRASRARRPPPARPAAAPGGTAPSTGRRG